MRRILISGAVMATAVATTLIAQSPPEPAPGDDVKLAPVAAEAESYWSRWRGPSGQGWVKGVDYVDTWSSTQNVKWRTTIPGLGHSSPIVWKDHLFLTTATDGGTKMAMRAHDRHSGKLLWETAVPSSGVEHIYPKNSHASATPVTDGRLVYASFGTHGLAAFDFSGKIVWHRKLGTLNNVHGSAGSPVLYKDRLFIYQDHRGSSDLGSFVGAFSTKDGGTLWWKDRSEQTGWGTPVVIQTPTRDELIVSSQRKVYAYSPDTGAELWTVTGNLFEVIPTPVVGHGFVFTSSGRAGPTMAIKPGGSGDVTATHVAWSSPKGAPFVPSAIVHGDLLYQLNDMQSILTAIHATTGEIAYQARLGVAMREGFSSSPVAVGNKLFFTNDDGQTFVVEAGPTFKLLHVNEMGARVLASPALVDGTWYWRTDKELIAVGR
ncbi:MAG: PQQ-binding-like beta-propeller repeat protein [Vicinamibacterales bacterium]